MQDWKIGKCRENKNRRRARGECETGNIWKICRGGQGITGNIGKIFGGGKCSTGNIGKILQGWKMGDWKYREIYRGGKSRTGKSGTEIIGKLAGVENAGRRTGNIGKLCMGRKFSHPFSHPS